MEMTAEELCDNVNTRIQQRLNEIVDNVLEPIVRNGIYPSQEQPSQPARQPSSNNNNEDEEEEEEEEWQQEPASNSTPQPSTSQEVQPLNDDDKQETICSICREKINMIITPCEHVFHPHCLQRWTIQTNNCPNCRNNLPESFKQK